MQSSMCHACHSGDCATKQTGHCSDTMTCPDNSQCVVISSDSYNCVCLPGYTGESCAVQILSQSSNFLGLETCTSANCSYSGECVYVGSMNFSCNCSDGFTGTWCETAYVDPDNCTQPNCAVNDCLAIIRCKNGRCINNNGSYYCKCDYGYEGASCGDVVTTMPSVVYGSSATTGAVITTAIWQSIAATNIAGAVSGVIVGGLVFMVCLFLMLFKLLNHRRALRKASLKEKGITEPWYYVKPRCHFDTK